MIKKEAPTSFALYDAYRTHARTHARTRLINNK